MASKRVSVRSLIAAYRSLGSHWADLDPLKRQGVRHPELDPAFYGLTEADLDQTYSATNTYFTTASTAMTLRDIPERRCATVCRSVGAEFIIFRSGRQALDPAAPRSTFQRAGVLHRGKRHILQQLTRSEGLERYLHTKYVGQKRFSLEGGELHRLDGRVGQPRRRIGRAGKSWSAWPTPAA